jgi:hypothetical protein
MTPDPVVVVPGDLDVEDRLVGPVTFRMTAWLAAAAGGVALVATSRGAPALVALGLLLVVVGVGGACWRPGGRPVGAWVVPLLAYRKRRAAGRVAAAPPEEVAAPSAVTEDAQMSPPRLVNGALLLRVAVVSVVIAAGVAVVVAAGGRASRRSPAPAAPSPVADVVAPEPAGPPIVVVVPVDPFTS